MFQGGGVSSAHSLTLDRETQAIGAPENALDLLFLDHAKEAYAPDLAMLERAGLVRSGAIVVADNVVFPGAPGYLEYVVKPRYETRLVAAPFETRSWETNWEEKEDAMSISTKLS